MNTLTLNYNDKQLFFNINSENINKGKITDIQTLGEIFNANCYQVRPEHLNGSKVVIDLGANIGAFSVLVAALGASKVYAYEPNPENYKILIDNIYNNNFEAVITPIQKAVIDKEDIVEMVGIGRNGKIKSLANLENKESKDITGGSDGAIFEAEGTTIEQVFNDIDEVDILKCDIEWAEYQIFSNVNKEILDKIKYLTMEFHGINKQIFGDMVANLTRSFVVETIGNYERGGFIRARRY